MSSGRAQPQVETLPGLDDAADTWIFEHGTEEVPRPDAGRAAPPSARYEPGAVLGVGATGEVVRAWDRHLERHVAMKRLRPELVGTAGMRRFIQEARIMGQLEHPGIVAVHDVGRDAEGRLFFTMEEVRGQRLDEVIDEASRARHGAVGRSGEPLARLVRVVVRVCEAVAFAHARGVVHRDLKPANIMVGAFGQVRVMDWGLALLRESRHTERAAIAGTPAYMAPEQLGGDLDKVGPAADIYALGAVLAECLTGERPPTPTGEGWRLELGSSGPGGTSLPRELRAVVWRATAPVAHDRYPTVTALQQDLEAWLESRPLPSLRYGGLALTRKWVVRHRAAVVGGAVVAVAASVVLAMGLVRYVDDMRAGTERAQRAEVYARQRLAEAQVASGHALAASGRYAEARYLYRQGLVALASMARSTLGPRVGLWATHHEARSPLVRLSAPPRALLAVDPDKDRVAALGDNGELRVERLPTQQLEARWMVPGRPVAVAFEGGEVAAYTQVEDRLERHLPAVGTRMVLASGAPAEASWSVGREGRVVVGAWPEEGRQRGRLFSGGRTVLAGDAHVHSIGATHGLVGGYMTPTVLWDLRTLSPVRQVCPTACRGAVSGDGKLLVLYDEVESALWVEDLATGQLRWRQAAKNMHLVRFTPDGGHVVAAGLEPAVDVLDAATGEPIARLEGHGRGLAGIAVGDRFIVTRDRQDRALVWRRPEAARSGEVLRVAPPSAADVSAGAHLLAVASDAHLLVTEVTTGQRVLEADLPVRRITDLAFEQRQSHALVAAGEAGVLRLDLARGSWEQAWARPAALVDAAEPGRAVVVGPEGEVALLDLATGQALWEDDHTLLGRSWSAQAVPSQALLAVASYTERAVGVWNLRTGQPLARLQADAELFGVAVAPDGQAIAATDMAGHLHLWSWPDQEAQVVDLHDGPAKSVAFSPGGGSLVTAGFDWSVRYLDRDGLEQVYVGRQHDAPVSLVLWPTNDVLITVDDRGEIIVRDLDLDRRTLLAREALEGWEAGRTRPGELADALDLHDLHVAAAAVRRVSPRETGGWLDLARSLWLTGDLAGARDAFEQAQQHGEAPGAFLEVVLASLDRGRSATELTGPSHP